MSSLLAESVDCSRAQASVAAERAEIMAQIAARVQGSFRGFDGMIRYIRRLLKDLCC